MYGLGFDFIGFSSTQINKDQLLTLATLLSLAESHEIFMKTVHSCSSFIRNIVFVAQHGRSSQIFCQQGHYATYYPDRYGDANSQNHIGGFLGPSAPFDWYLDTGAMTHMTNTVANLDGSCPYTSFDKVVVGNGAKLNIMLGNVLPGSIQDNI